jgi:hypothetical protein
MRIKSSQDLATAILFIAVGLGAFFIGAGYPMGTPQRLGTGVLPRILAWCLMGTISLGDSVTSSTWIRFSVRTPAREYYPPRRLT